MKARLKGTAEWLEATALFFADGEHYGFRLGDDKEHFYYVDALEFERETDWDAYRREVAKDIMCAILRSNQTDDDDKHFLTFEDLAKASVACADSLIKQLKEV